MQTAVAVEQGSCCMFIALLLLLLLRVEIRGILVKLGVPMPVAVE